MSPDDSSLVDLNGPEGKAQFRAAAAAFLTAAVRVLTSQRVLPTSVFNPYVQVGHDYEGGSIMGLPEYRRLVDLTKRAHPRFDESISSPEWDDPGAYVFEFLEASIASSYNTRASNYAGTEGRDRAFRDFLSAISNPDREIAVCRLFTRMTTESGAPLECAGVTVNPVGGEPAEHRRRVADLVRSVIPLASSAYRTDPQSEFAPPDSVLVARAVETGQRIATPSSHGTINRFVLLSRLLKGGTGTSQYEVQGEVALVGSFGPRLIPLDAIGWGIPPVERIAVIGEGDCPQFDGINDLLKSCAQPPGQMITSLDMALHKFEVSYRPRPWWERVVDLTTALEACLSGTANTDILLRVSMRAAALLSTPSDNAASLFNDIKKLYELRSKLVHGGALSEKSMNKILLSLSTVFESTPAGYRIEFAVDRLRDLVRRGLLMRLCLGAENEEGQVLWPLGDDAGVDVALSDDVVRREWRDAWLGRLNQIGALVASEPVAPLNHLFSRGGQAG